MKDHRIEIYLDAITYLALTARVSEQERTISQHIRYLVRQDLEQSLDDANEANKGGRGVMEGKA